MYCSWGVMGWHRAKDVMHNGWLVLFPHLSNLRLYQNFLFCDCCKHCCHCWGQLIQRARVTESYSEEVKSHLFYLSKSYVTAQVILNEIIFWTVWTVSIVMSLDRSLKGYSTSIWHKTSCCIKSIKTTIFPCNQKPAKVCFGFWLNGQLVFDWKALPQITTKPQ